MMFGYPRASTSDQSTEIQASALKAAGCEIVRSETKSSSTRAERTELRILLDLMRAGDTLMVTRIDRLARSIGDLRDIVHTLKAKRVNLKATEQPIDTSTASGKLFLDMLSVFAEFETSLRKERQIEGIAKAKLAGRYKGRVSEIDVDTIKALQAEGMGATQIANRLGISRATVYRFTTFGDS